jgi:GTP-binding protein EngB required for normal cell division
MSKPRAVNKASSIEPNRHCRPEREINILLLGPTGVGKSTFINGLANYMCNDTLDQAVNDEMQSVIPSSFTYTSNENFDETAIIIGKNDEFETFAQTGQSCTQQCRSFLFPVGDRNLRIIDTPGIGDTRGLEQDTKNFHDILTYISQYECLNGICILLKPNEERLTILLKFCVNELLRHIHLTASENIIFIFTNARSTFFEPGATTTNIRALLNKHENDNQVKVPFTRENTFLLDNEPFRYLALRRNGIQLNQQQTLSYSNSWDRTVKEYARLVAYIVTRPPHGVRDTLSLNEAEQLIRKLTRPIAETAKLIEQNIQLAKQHKQNVLHNPQIASQGIPQQDARINKLKHPRTVCVGKNCCRLITVNNEQKVEYTSECHDECYLKSFVQETINDPLMRECEVMDYKTGKIPSFSIFKHRKSILYLLHL